MTRVTLLGPQRARPTASGCLDSLGVEGPVALVTAGWQEREAEEVVADEALRRRASDLRLHGRGERVFRRDPELAEAHRRRQQTLRRMRSLYNVRLDPAMKTVHRLLSLRREPEDLLREEVRAAIDAVRTLDARHLERVRDVRDAFNQKWRPQERDAVRHERRELERELAGAPAVAIAGGHVAVLLNRLLLFDLAPLLARVPVVVAWSAGAMTLAERIVLFHDSPPWGPGHAEVFDTGLGFVPGVVPLPHAARRLRLDDERRVSIMARRFAPGFCVPMDGGARVDWREADAPGARDKAFLARVHGLRADGTIGAREAA